MKVSYTKDLMGTGLLCEASRFLLSVRIFSFHRHTSARGVTRLKAFTEAEESMAFCLQNLKVSPAPNFAADANEAALNPEGPIPHAE